MHLSQLGLVDAQYVSAAPDPLQCLDIVPSLRSRSRVEYAETAGPPGGLQGGSCRFQGDFVPAWRLGVGFAEHRSIRSGAAANDIIVADHSETNLELGLSLAAIVLATINMVGGFVVTDRMLEMFKPKKTDANGKPEANGKNGGAE